MLRLQIEGKYIDIRGVDIEMKWKHPVTTSLIGESTEFSNDIKLELTENNISVTDFAILRDSSKTHKFLYGHMYLNSELIPIRAYITAFDRDSITINISKFKSGGITDFLKDGTTIDKMYDDEILAGTKRDVVLNLETGAVIIPDFSELPLYNVAPLTNIFSGLEMNSRRYISARADVIMGRMGLKHGITTVGMPTGYRVMCNQYQTKNTSLTVASKWDITSSSSDPLVNVTSQSEAMKMSSRDATVTITSTVDFVLKFNFKLNFEESLTFTTVINLIANKGLPSEVLLKSAYLYTYPPGSDYNRYCDLANKLTLPAGTYNIGLWTAGGSAVTSGIRGTTQMVLFARNITDETNIEAMTGNIACWQNLPKITAKKLFETVAIAAGKMIQYNENSIEFIDFDDVFSYANAFDASDYFVEFRKKTHRVLANRINKVTYADGTTIAFFNVEDETLGDGETVVAKIEAIRVEDDWQEERNKKDVILRKWSGGAWDIRSKLQTIYAPLVKPYIFEAKFRYFKQNKQPILVRNLNGIFIALETITTTSDTIILKLLKIR